MAPDDRLLRGSSPTPTSRGKSESILVFFLSFAFQKAAFLDPLDLCMCFFGRERPLTARVAGVVSLARSLFPRRRRFLLASVRSSVLFQVFASDQVESRFFSLVPPFFPPRKRTKTLYSLFSAIASSSLLTKSPASTGGYFSSAAPGAASASTSNGASGLRTLSEATWPKTVEETLHADAGRRAPPSSPPPAPAPPPPLDAATLSSASGVASTSCIPASIVPAVRYSSCMPACSSRHPPARARHALASAARPDEEPRQAPAAVDRQQVQVRVAPCQHGSGARVLPEVGARGREQVRALVQQGAYCVGRAHAEADRGALGDGVERVEHFLSPAGISIFFLVFVASIFL